MVEHLLSTHKALVSIPSTRGKKKKTVNFTNYVGHLLMFPVNKENR